MQTLFEIMVPIKAKLKEEVSGINKEIRSKVSGYIVAAFGLVAGLAWNDAIKSLIDFYFPKQENSLWAKFIYAGLITLVLVIVSIYIVRFLKGKESGDTKK